MGCCLTTTATDDLKTHAKTRDTSPPGSGEETVKEVLSETPVTTNKPPPINSTLTNITAQNDVVQMAHGFLNLKNNSGDQDDVVQMAKILIEETASEVSSELYSYTGSLSAATTTTVGTGIGIDEDGEVTQKVNKPPPVKMVSRRQPPEKRGVRPPSPARRQVSRSTDRNYQLTSRTITTAQRSRNVVSSNVVGREPSRRLRSPAVRGEAGRLRRVKEKIPVENSGRRVPVKKSNDVGVMPVPEPEPEINELLDNPLVSLECFIFL
ncbi:hypothetical protein L1987_38017 [Smallanthus sonchifolius]|uniref:Uncharacterized protein n=1 Tax=Smallanthus sonchifolius TaxID=185202 RepID=A0ACB9HJS2_9ASTR|nr:hypothetical protein L1987_38017 [Smallanthus sonchifolius]